ncbi:hypothetical protein FQN54_009216 [Arachnomyces sp. PD_36]|nr:hypothetical protein FQN54_009216 [Arachnomyces sp. PD_36]
MAFIRLAIGIELECVLAFHEHVLEHVLNREGQGTQIVKYLSDQDINDITLTDGRSKGEQTSPYQNWGLTNPHPEKAGSFCGTTRDGSIRSYSNEPLIIASDVVGQNTPITRNDRLTSIVLHTTNWQVGYNGDLPSVSRGVRRQYLGPQISEEELYNWDCVGIRLTSKIFLAPTSSMDSSPFDSIARVLNLLRGSKNQGYRAFTTGQCRIRVRLGFDQRILQQETLSRTLQHLAYLLFLYEKTISSFHPPYSPDDPRSPPQRTWTSIADSLLSNAGLSGDNYPWPTPAEESLPLPQLIQKTIFSSTLDGLSLASLMSDARGKSIVDWSNLKKALVHSDKPTARFIEFRHHEATLDPIEVEHWIRFVVAIFHAAQAKLVLPVPVTQLGGVKNIDYRHEAGKYHVKDSSDPVVNLMYLLNLDSASQEHWIRRYRKFSSFPPRQGLIRAQPLRPQPPPPTSRLRNSLPQKRSVRLLGCTCLSPPKPKPNPPTHTASPPRNAKTVRFAANPVSAIQFVPARSKKAREEAEKKKAQRMKRAERLARKRLKDAAKEGLKWVAAPGYRGSSDVDMKDAA